MSPALTLSLCSAGSRLPLHRGSPLALRLPGAALATLSPARSLLHRPLHPPESAPVPQPQLPTRHTLSHLPTLAAPACLRGPEPRPGWSYPLGPLSPLSPLGSTGPLRGARAPGSRGLAVSSMATSQIAREPPAEALAPLPANPRFKIALCQLAVTADKTKNIAHAKEAIEKAADEGAKLILLPEMWNCPYSNDSFPAFAEDIQAPDFPASPSAAMLRGVASSRGVTIVGGSIPERRDGKLYNTCLVFGTDGALLGQFSKVHLFDIDIPGKMTFKESLTLTAGDQLLTVDTEVGRLGVAICYDIRFPELAMLYAARGVHMLCYPGAFNMTTGPLHWELLQRARATDNQVYVATCSPARDDSASYRAWGHSTLCGPFGEVLATTEHEEATVIAEVDLAVIPERRQSLPFSTQRRGDLYALVDKSRT